MTESELADYSGKFDPKFSYDKLSKETLLKLLKMYSQYMFRLDGFWYLAVMEKCGNDVAFDCDVKVWERLQPYETKAVSSLLNIQGNDVVTVMKFMQASLWTLVSYSDYVIDIKNNDHAVVTYRNCPILHAMEREGTGREKLICQEMEPKMFGIIAHHFNPKIKIIGLKVPPRTDYKDVCCQWQYKLDR